MCTPSFLVCARLTTCVHVHLNVSVDKCNFCSFVCLTFLAFQQRNLKQKFVSLLRRFKVNDEVSLFYCSCHKGFSY